MLKGALSVFFNEPLPHLIGDLIAMGCKIMRQYPRSKPPYWRVSRKPALPFIPQQDSPSASFYRLYQFIIIDDHIAYRNELEYFCQHHEWAVYDIPDPKDHESPSRYAALAAVTRLMCKSFNRRIELGLPRDAPPIIEDFEELSRRPKIFERVPKWAEKVSPLSHPLYIPNKAGDKPGDEDEDINEDFKKYNIIIKEPHIHFI